MNAARRYPAGHPVVESERRRATLVRLGWPMLGLLIVEFLLGMALALFVSLPMGAGVGAILASSPVLIVHLVVAIFLVGISTRALVLALQLGDRAGIGVGALALASALIAFFAGTMFAFGGQAAWASYVMSTGFAGILVAAVLLLSLGHWPARPAALLTARSREHPIGSKEG